MKQTLSHEHLQRTALDGDRHLRDRQLFGARGTPVPEIELRARGKTIEEAANDIGRRRQIRLDSRGEPEKLPGGGS